MKNIIYIFVLTSCFACESLETKTSSDADSINELIEVAKSNNNFSLNILRDANKFILEVSKTELDQLNSNISKIDKLYKLNNSKNIQSSELIKALKTHNKTSEEKYQIKIKSESVDNKIDYYMYLDKLINKGNLSPGTVNEPRLLLPYAVNNSKFNSLKGEILKVPIKTFRERDVTQWRYELFDTLNFHKTAENEGYFKISTSDRQLGTSTEKLKIHGKDLYTGKTEIIGNEEIEITLTKR